MEQKKGKLLKATPLIVNGVHYSKENDYKGIKSLLYYFNVEFDNGDVGTARSKNPQGNFKIGEEYSYNVNVFNNNGHENKSFSSLKNLSNPYSGYRRENPENQKEIMNQVALLATNMVMRKIDKEFLEVYKALRSWLYTQVLDNGEDSRSMSGVLKIAAGYYQEADIKNVHIESVTKYADSLIKLIKDTTWKETTQNQSSKNTSLSSQEVPAQNPTSQEGMKLPEVPQTGTQEAPADITSTSDLPF